MTIENRLKELFGSVDYINVCVPISIDYEWSDEDITIDINSLLDYCDFAQMEQEGRDSEMTIAEIICEFISEIVFPEIAENEDNCAQPECLMYDNIFSHEPRIRVDELEGVNSRSMWS